MNSSIINIILIGGTAIIFCLLHTNLFKQNKVIKKISISEFKIQNLLIIFVLITLLYLLVYWSQKTTLSLSFYLLMAVAIMLEILSGVGKKND